MWCVVLKMLREHETFLHGPAAEGTSLNPRQPEVAWRLRSAIGVTGYGRRVSGENCDGQSVNTVFCCHGFIRDHQGVSPGGGLRRLQ